MRTKDPDVVVVGAGIAGASIAAVLARSGLEVLLLERQGRAQRSAASRPGARNPTLNGVVLLGDAEGYDDPVDGQGLSLAMRDVRQLSELLLATDDWTLAGLRPYGQQRAERLRRIRRVSLTFAALMTTFTADSRARRGRFTRPRGLAGTTSGWHLARSISARTACQ